MVKELITLELEYVQNCEEIFTGGDRKKKVACKMIGQFSIKALGSGTYLCIENFFSQTLIFAWTGHFQELHSATIWPFSVKFGQMLEKNI